LPEQPLPADQWAQHYNLYLPDGKTCMKKEDVPLFRALQGECVSNVEMMIVPKHGTARTLLTSGQALFDAQGKKLGAVAVMHDITLRKQAEEALRKSEAKNRALLNAIPDLILCISKDGTYLDCKPPTAFNMLMLGNNLIGKSEYEVFPPAVAQQRMHYVEQALSTGEPQIFEYQLLLNGNICDEEARIVASGDSEALVIVRDITERKRVEQHIRTLNAELEQRVSERTAALSRSLEELASEIAERKLAESALRVSEAKFRRLVDSNIVGVIISDFSGNIKEANNAFLQMVGYTREELVSGKIRWREITPDEYLPKDERAIEQINCSGACAPFEKEYIRKDGSRVPILLGCALLEGAQDTAICFVLDLSERKQAEDQLKASLYEKEVLLKEIHHRVKNNMQVICSLLNLQSASISDPKTLELLQEGQNRVASMALVHEQLYESEDLARIDFGDYIQNLAANLLSSYDVSSDAIALKINVDNVLLGVDAAIPCGLIINELVSNSLKYAFPPSPQRGLRISPGNQGEIRIDFHAENDNHLHLTVSDNGVGFPQDLDFQNTETLGLQLVTALTGQLSGTIKLERNMGTKFKITFPH
jgi:PAS domain S-box-containing protein